MKRREFLKKAAAASAAFPFFLSCAKNHHQKKMIILGIDGLDPGIVARMMSQGLLPNLQRVAGKGTFTMMHSTIPPQSPVAWGSFITGADPGIHGIFDFVHRDPKTYFPKFSLTENLEPRWFLKLGKYQLPLKPGKIILQRKGKPFWDDLEENGVKATIFKVPSNFPPSTSGQNTLAGMGTPDLLGGNGIFTLFTSDEEEFQRDLAPHRVYYADIDENGVMKDAKIEGPPNSLIKEGENMTIPFTVYIDKLNHTIRIDIQGNEILLSEKEYSAWVEIKFSLIDHIQALSCMAKFYLLEMGKRFRLYVSPLQINPLQPELPISTPDDYCLQLAKKNGLFHTLGLPADFNAIKTSVFSIENFITQSQSIFTESEKLFKAELARFLDSDEGVLFFYFSSLDQGQHIFWALNDPAHPFHQPEEGKRFGHVTGDLYRRCDLILGDALKQIPPDVSIMVISDHGFAPFYKKVNVNNWLIKGGYLNLKQGESENSPSLALSADWGKTKAYGLGLNGLYLNMKGRESEGIVSSGERRKLLEELKAGLESIKDAQTGQQVISRAFIAEDCFSASQRDRAPDIIIGFNRGFRCDDRFGEGGLSPDFIAPNLSWWSGDHCIDPFKVPATFIANFPINRRVPSITDLAPTILNYFGIKPHPGFTGKTLT